MSLLSFLSGIITPVTTTIDELHTSEEEKLKLRNELAQIEAKMSVKLLDLQSKVIDANAKVAVAEQQYGNILSRSWRPLVSICFALGILAMSVGWVAFNQTLAATMGTFLVGIGGLRSWEKKK